MRQKLARAVVSIALVMAASSVPAGTLILPPKPSSSDGETVGGKGPKRVDMTVPVGWLSAGLRDYLKKNGWELVWRSGTDFKVPVSYVIPAANVVDVVQELSKHYRFPAKACMGNKPPVVVVYQPGTIVSDDRSCS